MLVSVSYSIFFLFFSLFFFFFFFLELSVSSYSLILWIGVFELLWRLPFLYVLVYSFILLKENSI